MVAEGKMVVFAPWAEEMGQQPRHLLAVLIWPLSGAREDWIWGGKKPPVAREAMLGRMAR